MHGTGREATDSANFAGGWSLRDHIADQAQAKREAAAATAALNTARADMRRSTEAAALSDRVGQRSAQRQNDIRTVTNEIIREVPVYVTEKADAGCIITRGFVSLHDAAASGRVPAAVPDTSAASHDAASGVEISAVAETLSANYGLCHADQERLSSLQQWIRAQAAAWNAGPHEDVGTVP